MIGQKHDQTVESERGSGARRETVVDRFQKRGRLGIFRQMLLPSGFGKPFETFPLDSLVPGCLGIRFTAKRLRRPERLYTTERSPLTDAEAVAIPYALWQNREKSEMTIFMPFRAEI